LRDLPDASPDDDQQTLVHAATFHHSAQ